MSITSSLIFSSDKVQSIYNAFYGRPADPAGLDFWVNQLQNNGGDLRAILPSFGESAESNALFALDSSSDAVVKKIYNIILQREPDQGGLNFYKQKLDSGQLTKSEVAFAIYDGINPQDPIDGARALNALNIANQFSEQLRQNSSFNSGYAGDPAAAVGRELLARISSSDSHTAGVSSDLVSYMNERLIQNPAGSVSDPFDFKLVYSNSAASGYTAQFEKAFAKLETFFFKGVPNYVDPSTGKSYDDLEISIEVKSVDGGFGTVAFAGPELLRPQTNIPFKGSMVVDSADIDQLIRDGLFDTVVIHEAFHALGFGTLWDTFNYNNVNGRYVGEQGLLEYRAISSNESATFVPLERSTLTSSDNAHWSESVFDKEIMTPIVDNNPVFSKLSLAALQDLGYSINYNGGEFFMV